VAHLQAHLYDSFHANREDVKVVQELLRHQLFTDHDGHLGASADARKTAGTAESGGDGAVGKASVGGPKDGLTAPQNCSAAEMGNFG